MIFHRPRKILCRSQWPRGLRLRSTAARLLRLWVRIPSGAWMDVCCECCVLSGRGLCDALITRPEESYRLWCVVVCDLETSRMRRPWPTLGRSATGGGGLCLHVLSTSCLIHNPKSQSNRKLNLKRLRKLISTKFKTTQNFSLCVTPLLCSRTTAWWSLLSSETYVQY